MARSTPARHAPLLRQAVLRIRRFRSPRISDFRTASGRIAIHRASPPADAANVVAHLGRYTHKTAIANHHLVDFDGEQVRFRWRDYAHSNKRKVMRLDASEFIRRFLLHVLPRRFTRLRHYGVLANRSRTRNLALCRGLIGQPEPEPRKPETPQAMMLRLTGIDDHRAVRGDERRGQLRRNQPPALFLRCRALEQDARELRDDPVVLRLRREVRLVIALLRPELEYTVRLHRFGQNQRISSASGPCPEARPVSVPDQGPGAHGVAVVGQPMPEPLDPAHQRALATVARHQPRLVWSLRQTEHARRGLLDRAIRSGGDEVHLACVGFGAALKGPATTVR